MADLRNCGPLGARSRGLSGPPRSGLRRLLVATAAGLALGIASSASASTFPNALGDDLPRAKRTASTGAISVIVRERRPHSSAAERIVRKLGGTVTRQLPIVGGFAARVPAPKVSALRSSPTILRVWRDGRIHMSSDGDDDDDDDIEKYDHWTPNLVWRIAARIPGFGYGPDGKGVTVALLDTGVNESEDLDDRVLARVDFTKEGDGYDRFGHGTHMAGIIAGDGSEDENEQWISGVAAGANLVSVKVAGWDGSTDVSMVLAGLQWVVSNRERFGIRVLNLSFGTNSAQNYRNDPLDYAVERVWASGIVVVTAAGNRGPTAGTVNKPGDDAYAITVGAADVRDTVDPRDDAVAAFSSRGPTQDGLDKPDILAPGITIVSIRAVDSVNDVLRPAARVGEYYFKGTGTSQATAIISGVAALMLQVNPRLTPDMVKAILMRTANKTIAGQPGAGEGLVDGVKALQTSNGSSYSKSPANQGVARSNGLGSLEASRGTHHVYADVDHDDTPELVVGEIDVLGNPWDATKWVSTLWTAATWASSPWAVILGDQVGDASAAPANPWYGTNWDSQSWSSQSWSSQSWSSQSWSSQSWSSQSWSSQSWSTWN